VYAAVLLGSEYVYIVVRSVRSCPVWVSIVVNVVPSVDPETVQETGELSTPNPDAKLYDDRTNELGAVISIYLGVPPTARPPLS
jgi:hypothetical protein